MNFPAGVNGPIVGLCLIIASQLAAWLVGLVRGGFRVGRLAKTIELRINREELPALLGTAHLRLEELGFRPGATVGQFIQSGVAAGGLASFTHTKTKKALTLTVHDQMSSEARVTMRMLYLDPILADTGESAHRDAVMAYISGQTDSMTTVANRSFTAFSCLTGGIMAWAAVLFLKVVDYHPLWMPLTIITISNAITGTIAIYAIARRPRELTGMSWAILGMILATSATAFAIACSLKMPQPPA